MYLWLYNSQLIDGEGMTAISSDEEGTILVVGGCFGHVRLINWKLLQENVKDVTGSIASPEIRHWRGHLQSVCSSSHVKQFDMILTAARDAAVRLWTINGTLRK